MKKNPIDIIKNKLRKEKEKMSPAKKIRTIFFNLLLEDSGSLEQQLLMLADTFNIDPFGLFISCRFSEPDLTFIGWTLEYKDTEIITEQSLTELKAKIKKYILSERNSEENKEFRIMVSF